MKNKPDYSALYFTPEEFRKTYELTKGFDGGKFSNRPVRNGGLDFYDFVESGCVSLLEKHPDFVKEMMQINMED